MAYSAVMYKILRGKLLKRTLNVDDRRYAKKYVAENLLNSSACEITDIPQYRERTVPAFHVSARPQTSATTYPVLVSQHVSFE